jgi:uncharacterized protein YkwD
MTSCSFSRFSLSLFAVLAVSGCGGGDSDNNGSSVAANPTPATTIASNYTEGSEERAVFELLNEERTRCGFGTLTQSAQLDTAARGHADYQALNDLFTHVQDITSFPRGFTGERPIDRVTAAGYLNAGAVGDEIVRFTGTNQKAGLGTRGVRDLLSAPYHLRGLMGGYRDIGVSVRASADVGSTARRVVVQVNAAYKTSAGPQRLPEGEVRTYPCEGTADVNRQLRSEFPNPIPDRDLAVQPLGPVVYVAGREGATLLIRSAAMTEADTGRTVALRPPVTAANDPYRFCQEGCFQPHEAYLAADAPLPANTRYRVTVSGSSDGAAFSREFMFVTGTGG